MPTPCIICNKRACSTCKCKGCLEFMCGAKTPKHCYVENPKRTSVLEVEKSSALEVETFDLTNVSIPATMEVDSCNLLRGTQQADLKTMVQYGRRKTDA